MTAARPSLQALQDLLSSDTAFAKSFGFRVTEAEAGECRLVVPFNPLFERPGGILRGQVFMAAADVAMRLAIKTLRGIDDDSVTISMQSSFLRSARQEDVVCHRAGHESRRRTLAWHGRMFERVRRALLPSHVRLHEALALDSRFRRGVTGGGP